MYTVLPVPVGPPKRTCFPCPTKRSNKKRYRTVSIVVTTISWNSSFSSTGFDSTVLSQFFHCITSRTNTRSYTVPSAPEGKDLYSFCCFDRLGGTIVRPGPRSKSLRSGLSSTRWSTSLRKKSSNFFRPAFSVVPPMLHTIENTNAQSTKILCSFSFMLTSSPSATRNGSMRDSKMFINANGRLMSDVGMSSLQFFLTKRRHGSTSHSKRSSRRSLCSSPKASGNVFIHDRCSGSHPISVGST